MKVEGIEDLLRNLIDCNSEELLSIYQKEKLFPIIVNNLFQILSSDHIFKLLEVSMDFLEFLLTTLPEALFMQIESMIHCLLRLVQNKREEVSRKANELVNLA